MKLFISVLLTVGAVALAGCGDSRDSHGHDHAGHGHEHDSGPGHSSGLPHGGTPVNVADHRYHLELVRDATEGKLLAYVLDGHLEKYIAVPETNFTLIARFDGREATLEFVRAAAAGGASSPFEARAEWIKTTARFEGSVPAITLNGETFKNISFPFPQGTQHQH